MSKKKETKKETKKDIYKLKTNVPYLTVLGYQFIGNKLEVDEEGRDLLIQYPQIEEIEGD